MLNGYLPSFCLPLGEWVSHASHQSCIRIWSRAHISPYNALLWSLSSGVQTHAQPLIGWQHFWAMNTIIAFIKLVWSRTLKASGQSFCTIMKMKMIMFLYAAKLVESWLTQWREIVKLHKEDLILSKSAQLIAGKTSILLLAFLSKRTMAIVRVRPSFRSYTLIYLDCCTGCSLRILMNIMASSLNHSTAGLWDNNFLQFSPKTNLCPRVQPNACSVHIV